MLKLFKIKKSFKMKKLFLVFAVAAFFVACNSGTSSTEVKTDSVTNVTPAPDTTVVVPAHDSTVKVAADTTKKP